MTTTKGRAYLDELARLRQKRPAAREAWEDAERKAARAEGRPVNDYRLRSIETDGGGS